MKTQKMIPRKKESSIMLNVEEMIRTEKRSLDFVNIKSLESTVSAEQRNQVKLQGFEEYMKRNGDNKNRHFFLEVCMGDGRYRMLV